MSYYEKQRCLLIISYIVAVIIKVYNNWYYYYLKINIEVKQKEMDIQQVIRLSYYEFYTKTLRETETSYSFFNFFRFFRKSIGLAHDKNTLQQLYDDPFYMHILRANHILAILVAVQIGNEYQDF